MFLGTLGASLLGNLLTSKGTIRPDEGKIRAGEAIIRGDQSFLIPAHIQLILKWMNGNNVTHFNSSRVDHIIKGIKKFIRNKNIINFYVEYKHTNRQCVDTFVMGLSILC